VAVLAAPVIAQTAGSTTRMLRDTAIGAPAVPLKPPPPRPPAGLELAPGSPLQRARGHLADADVLDALGVRAARRLDLLAQGLPDDDGCQAARASWSALAMAADEAHAQQVTATALLEAVGDEAAYDDADGLAHRLRHLRGEQDRLGPVLRSGGCEPPSPERAEPRVFLPDDRRGPRAGRVAIFVRAEPETNVIWVGAQPAAVLGPAGWAVVVVADGDVALCAARPEDTACRAAVAVEASMGAAFELSPAG